MRTHPRPGGFTLIELLVVIGILVLLIGLLFPVVARVQRSAKIAATQQLISTIANGIQQYQSEFGALPGPRAPGQAFQIPTPAINPTTSEELLLSLRGGLKWGGSGIEYDVAEIGRGPVSLNGTNKKRYRDFLSATVAMTSGDMPEFAGDTEVPEFLDSFGDPKPVLYLRANKGATGIVSTDPQWSISLLGAYGFPIDDDEFKAAGDFTTADDYFKNPSMPAQTRQKDNYVLISAGLDGIYGTKDDITNFGTPGE